MNKCQLCGKTHGLFSLEVDNDDGTVSITHICGGCYDVVAQIALRVVKFQMAKKENE